MQDADFPLEEYEARYQKLKELMRASGIDCVLVTHGDNLGYFSGFRRAATSRGGYCLLLPLVGTPQLVLKRMYVPDAEATSWVKDLHPWGGARRFELPTSHMRYVSQILAQLGLDKKTIGMEFGNGMRVEATQLEIESLRAGLPQGRFVDASGLFWKLRLVKSPAEVECLRKACLVTVKAMEEGLKSVRPGVSERELLRIVYMKMLEQGAEDLPLNLYMHVFGGPISYALGDPRPSHRKLERGDLVIFDGGSCEKGYFSDITRVACIGEPTRKQSNMYNAALSATNAAIDEVRPGQKIQKVSDVAGAIIRKEGYEKYNPFDGVGHSIGLEVHEPPTVGPQDGDVTIEPNMVFAIETWLYDEPLLHGGVGDAQVGFEDNVLVTREGHEILTRLKSDLWIV